MPKKTTNLNLEKKKPTLSNTGFSTFHAVFAHIPQFEEVFWRLFSSCLEMFYKWHLQLFQTQNLWTKRKKWKKGKPSSLTELSKYTSQINVFMTNLYNVFQLYIMKPPMYIKQGQHFLYPGQQKLPFCLVWCIKNNGYQIQIIAFDKKFF